MAELQYSLTPSCMRLHAGETESMVRKGGLYVNFERVQSTDELFSKEKHVLAGSTTVIRIGKLVVGVWCGF